MVPGGACCFAAASKYGWQRQQARAHRHGRVGQAQDLQRRQGDVRGPLLQEVRSGVPCCRLLRVRAGRTQPHRAGAAAVLRGREAVGCRALLRSPQRQPLRLCSHGLQLQQGRQARHQDRAGKHVRARAGGQRRHVLQDVQRRLRLQRHAQRVLQGRQGGRAHRTGRHMPE